MNAYELADLMGGYAWKSANMLRQQADRIAELEKQSEPVAWMAEHYDGRKRVEIAGNVYDQDAGWGHKRIPLYTKPQTKPLSDEEIIDCLTAWAKEKYGDIYLPPSEHQTANAVEMARAIEAKVRGEK